MKRVQVTSVVLAVLLAAALAAPALADGPSAVAWLKAQQNADGGFGGSLGDTADALIAIAAIDSGSNALTWSYAGKTPLDYFKTNIGQADRAGIVGKVIIALIAWGQNPRTALGSDLVVKLENWIGSDGKFGGAKDFVNEHCFALIALASAQRPIPVQAVNYLLQRQIADGTWAWNGDTQEGSGDNNTTALVVVALTAAGLPTDHVQIVKAMTHLKKQQNADGGFPYINPSPWGTDSDSNSTALAMWAVKSAGQDPAGIDWKFAGQDGKSAHDRLRAWQNNSGAFRWQDSMPADNFASTVQAMVALQMKTLPLARMDVGDAAVAPTAPASQPPTTLPETGFDAWTWVVLLLSSGAALTGAGLRLRKQR